MKASLSESEKFPFVFGHEVGHFFLHQDLKVNQERYNDFQDSEYDIFTDRYHLVNEKNWIEWQANKFAIGLFLPKEMFLKYMVAFRKARGISRAERIYLDNQPVNIVDYFATVDYLSKVFGISKTAVKYRIEDLKVISDVRGNGRGGIRKVLGGLVFK